MSENFIPKSIIALGEDDSGNEQFVNVQNSISGQILNYVPHIVKLFCKTSTGQILPVKLIGTDYKLLP